MEDGGEDIGGHSVVLVCRNRPNRFLVVFSSFLVLILLNILLRYS